MPSKKQPRIIKKTVSATSSSTLVRSNEPIQAAKFRGMPVNPIDTDRKAAPININAIMHEVMVAPSKLSFNMEIESDLFDHARIIENMTPTAAASVGEAIPK